MGQHLFELSPQQVKGLDLLLLQRRCGPTQLIPREDLHRLAADGPASFQGSVHSPGDGHMGAEVQIAPPIETGRVIGYSCGDE